MTLGAYMETWLTGLMTEALAPTTIASYKTNVNAHIVARLGSMPLDAVTPTLIKQFYSELLTEGRRDGSGGLSPRTVNYVGTILGKAMRDAEAQRLINRNPALGVRKPRSKAKASKVRSWTAGQLRTFLDHVSGDRLYPIWMLASSTGLRRSELLGLRWEDVELDACRLSVRQGLVLVDNQPLLRATTKSSAARRSISLDSETTRLLRRWRMTQLEERMLCGGGYRETGLVATRPDGSWIHPERFSRWFEAHRSRAALPAIRAHDLRHTHATLLLQAGVHPKVVQERLGHSSITVTLDTYSHVIPAMQEDAAELAARLVQSAGR
jgi:integrase